MKNLFFVGLAFFWSAMAAAQGVDQKITLVNDSKEKIKIVRVTVKPQKKHGILTEFGPILPGEKRTHAVKIWPEGSTQIIAEYESGSRIEIKMEGEK